MTTRLYLENPYTTSFEADIVERREIDDGRAVVFESTYFYPESGGQPFDLGTIDGISVTKVIELPDETVLHFVERFPERDRVRCEIDDARRRDHMQQHSGQHILSAAFVRELGANTTSFHLGAQVSTIDLDRSAVTDEELERVEAAANDVVRRAVPIRSSFVGASEVEKLDLRKAPPDQEKLRLVEVEGFDNQACCGTHPRSAAEVGVIAVRSVAKFKQGLRVEFLCGDRARHDYRIAVTRIRSLASILSSSEEDLVDTASKLQDERKAIGKELSRMKHEAILANAESWMEKSDRVGNVSILATEAQSLGPADLRSLAMKLTERPDRVVLLGAVDEGRAHLVFARSENVDADMGALLKETVEAVGGRGGGSPRVAQGGGPETEGLAGAIDQARARLPLS